MRFGDRPDQARRSADEADIGNGVGLPTSVATVGKPAVALQSQFITPD